MSRVGRNLLLHLWNCVNFVLMVIPVAMCWYCYYADRIAAPFFDRGNWAVLALYGFLYLVFGDVYEIYEIGIQKRSMLIYSQGLAALMSDGVLFVVIWLLTHTFPNPLPGLAALAAQILLSVCWCIVAGWMYFGTSKAKRTAVVYDARQGMEELLHDYEMEHSFDVRRVLPVEECIYDPRCLLGYDAVFLSDVRSEDRNDLLKFCVANSIQVYVIPRIGDVIMSGAKRVHMLHLPVLQVGRYEPTPEFLLLKRLFDIVASAIVLVLLSPLMLVTSIAIKACDGGPVFYKQKRLTKDGREFDVLKFRSMRVDAEANGVARLSTGDDDPRITPVGRVCRKLRLDELPQLFNILAGDMSVVGPRPERPEIAAQYEEQMPEFSLRLQAKAGLTGYAQVYGKYNTTPYDKLQMDLMYIAKPSFLEDLKIIFATIQILFLPESTEGIAVGATTAMDYENKADSTENDAETVAK